MPHNYHRRDDDLSRLNPNDPSKFGGNLDVFDAINRRLYNIAQGANLALLRPTMIPKIPFGSTGHDSTRTLFGAAALGKVTQAQADETLATLLDFGVNHIDTAASYGEAELRIAPWMKNHRDDFFVATKTEKRSYAESKAQIDDSLKRLNVDHVDLLQLHSLGDEADWEKVFADDGAFKAVIEAKDAGKTRFAGITGHGVHIPRLHLRALEIYPFDAVLLPLNYPMSLNADYMSDFDELRAVCRERNIAMQTIKAVTRRPWGELERNRATWYQPLEEQDAIDNAVSWVFGNYPEVFLNTVGDVAVLPRVLDAAFRFESAPSDEAMAEMFSEREMALLFV